MIAQIKTYLPGIAISVFIAILATFLADYIPYTGSVLIALILGAIAGNTFMNGALCAPGLKFTEKKILETAIVFIGFGLEAHHLQTMSGNLMWFLLAMVVFVLLFSFVIGKLFKTSAALSFLLGAGSAICGSSAIAATAPIVEADEQETGLSLAIINVLGLVGLLGLPALGHLLSFTDMQTATLLGGVLQSLGHVVAAGFSVGNEVGEWATVVKMGRILFMVPLLIALFLIKRNQKGGAKAKFPVFIALFVAAVVIAQLEAVPLTLLAGLDNVGGMLLTVAMGAIGSKIQLKALFKISGKGVLHGTVLFTAQILVAIVAIWFFVE